MKRFLAVLLALALFFTLSACRKEKTSSNSSSQTSTTETTNQDLFVKPENYASVVTVTINPAFNLYLDISNNVLVVEPVNDDAKEIINKIDTAKGNIGAIVKSIVTAANDGGFVKENAEISFEITEIKDKTIDTNSILTKAKETAQNSFKELNIKVNVKTSVKKDAESFADKTTSSSQSQSGGTNNTSSTNNKTEDKKPTNTPTTSTESKPTHTHKFSDATCTEPQKCSCGATQGSALGHKWVEATCKAPKTCSVCKVTEGNTGDHKYIDGTCKFCSGKEVLNPKTHLKEGKNYYYVSTFGDSQYFLCIYQFIDSQLTVRDEPWGVYATDIPENDRENDDVINYKGKTFYPIGYGGPLPEYSITDEEIVLRFSEEIRNDCPDDLYYSGEYRLVVDCNYDLEVIYSSGTMFKEGDILDLVE